MKPLIFMILFYLSLMMTGNLAAQTVLSFQDAEAQGTDLNKLSEKYTSAVHVDSNQAVFKLKSEASGFLATWRGMLLELASFLY